MCDLVGLEIEAKSRAGRESPLSLSPCVCVCLLAQLKLSMRCKNQREREHGESVWQRGEFACGVQVKLKATKGRVSCKMCVWWDLLLFFSCSFFWTHLAGIVTGDRQLRCRVADAGTLETEARVPVAVMNATWAAIVIVVVVEIRIEMLLLLLLACCDRCGSCNCCGNDVLKMLRTGGGGGVGWRVDFTTNRLDERAQVKIAGGRVTLYCFRCGRRSWWIRVAGCGWSGVGGGQVERV